MNNEDLKNQFQASAHLVKLLANHLDNIMPMYFDEGRAPQRLSRNNAAHLARAVDSLAAEAEHLGKTLDELDFLNRH